MKGGEKSLIDSRSSSFSKVPIRLCKGRILTTMFKEIRGIAGNPNKIINQIVRRKITDEARKRYWNPDGTMRHGHGQTRKEYQESVKRASESAKKF